ncbi:hypothetical protein PUN28_013792 [Cardiocondyla obscurior]|uniref:Uncharacterized protein n=1 Tax=Cardiocondyla obscurior TaxID=286306 RepID=A0AAW2F323_9HYME
MRSRVNWSVSFDFNERGKKSRAQYEEARASVNVAPWCAPRPNRGLTEDERDLWNLKQLQQLWLRLRKKIAGDAVRIRGPDEIKSSVCSPEETNKIKKKKEKKKKENRKRNPAPSTISKFYV